MNGAKDRNFFEKIFPHFGAQLSLINLLNRILQTRTSIPCTPHHRERTRPDSRTHYVISDHSGSSKLHHHRRRHPKKLRIKQQNQLWSHTHVEIRSKDSNFELLVWGNDAAAESGVSVRQEWTNQRFLSLLFMALSLTNKKQPLLYFFLSFSAVKMVHLI